jgi:hypothetical protein
MPAQVAGEWGAVAEWEWGAEGDLVLNPKNKKNPVFQPGFLSI